MILSKQHLPKIVLTLIALLTIIAGYITFLHPMGIFPDPSWGFQVMRSMEHGGGFNMLVEPDHGNIAQDYGEFLSWWSPGQYLVPYFFKLLFHLNLGQSCVVTNLVCELVGLFGFYRFFRKAGFSTTVSTLSIAFVASQLFYVTPFVFYNGGEVLLFAFGGWFLYGCMAFNQPKSWKTILFIILSGWIGFMCKSSFMWIYVAGLCFMWIKTSRVHRFAGKWLINGIWLGIPAIISIAGIYIGYLSKGSTPASGGRGLKLAWETLTFPLASPFISGFSIDELTHGLLFHPDGAMFNYTVTIFIIVALAIASILVITRILRIVPNSDYKLMLVVFYVISVLFFSMAFLRQLAISYEGRHFRMMGLVFIPGAIYLVTRLLTVYKVLFAIVWLGIVYASVQYLTSSFEMYKHEGAYGVSGISQQFLDQPAIDELVRLDKTSKNAVFVFISADLGLEVEHNRFITLEPIGQDMKINYSDYQRCGHAGPLYIFLPSDYKGAKATMIMKSFEDYKGFKLTQLSEDYVLYSAE